MGGHTKAELEQSLRAIVAMIGRSEKAQAKFAAGTSQYTLQKNRIEALHIVFILVNTEFTGQDATCRFTKEELEHAVAPIASLTRKSEKAQQKLAPGTWQHSMLAENIKALRIAAPLLKKAVDLTSGGR